jgi:hypothetical protein
VSSLTQPGCDGERGVSIKWDQTTMRIHGGIHLQSLRIIYILGCCTARLVHGDSHSKDVNYFDKGVLNGPPLIPGGIRRNPGIPGINFSRGACQN